MDFKGKHILNTRQFDKESLLGLFEEAAEMEHLLRTDGQLNILEGKLMATLFFEPSTRTRFSFETAMLRLGGRVISNSDMMGTSSAKKRETLYDTGKVVSQMADVIAMRHPEAGAVAKLAEGSDVPVLNAGDGPGGHPTQGLLDLYTIWKEKGGIDGLTIGFVGDLKYGRVPHSQIELLMNFDVKMVAVAPGALQLPDEVLTPLREVELGVEETESLEEVIGDLDVIAMTRIQEERFEDKSEYEKYAGSYVLNAELMKKAKEDAIILHPLPRVDEISTDLDGDKRSMYFEQVGNGVALRMALLKKVLYE